MHPDYPVNGHEAIDRADELADYLQGHDGAALRVLGLGTHQQSLPAPIKTPRLISLSGMRSIVRLEAEDLTCSVEPGIGRPDLDAALADKGLQLPCEGEGSLGGLFASGGCSPPAPGAMSPRSLLLGMECLLAEGLAFKAGARVVKNVAGYDLQKLFVGSRGRLFIATLLHLKLRPAPKHRCCFSREGLDQNQALALYARLRLLTPAASALHLRRAADGFSIAGRMEGRSKNFAKVPTGEGLGEIAALERWQPPIDGPVQEIVSGHVRPSLLEQLLNLLPTDSEFTCNGTGAFEVGLAPKQSDSFLLRLPQLAGQAEIRMSSAERRGQATTIDPGHSRISRGLEQTLDPGNILQ